MRDRRTAATGGQHGRPALAPAVLLVCLVVVAFGRSTSFDFCGYDDSVYVSENPHVLRPSWRKVAYFWQAPYHGVYIPLGYTLYVGTSAAARGLGYGTAMAAEPGPFHAVGVALHALATVLAYVLLSRLGAKPWAAAAGAALFAVHPLQVESVAWVSGLPGVLGGALALAAMILYLDFQAARSSGRGAAAFIWIRYAAATALFALALLAKPLVVSVPAVLVAIDVFWFQRAWRQSLLPLAIWLAAAAGLTLLTQRQQSPDTLVYLTPLSLRPLVALDALGFYLVKLVWPLPLGPDYGRTPAEVTGHLGAYAGTISLPLVTATLFAVFRAGRAVWLAVAVFVLALAPVLGLAPFAHQNISTVADRYAYLALLGPAWLVAWGLSLTGLRWATVAVAGLAALTIVTFVQCAHWRDALTLADHTLAFNPAAWTMTVTKAVALDELGRKAEAAACYERGLAARPQDAQRHHGLGQWRHNQGDFPGALECFDRALAMLPEQPRFLCSYALALEGLKRYDEAAAYYRRVLAKNPGYTYAQMNLGRLLELQGRLEEAYAHFAAAAAREREDAGLWTQAGSLALRLGRVADAENALHRALLADPLAVAPRSALASLYTNTGRFPEAIETLRAAVAIAPRQYQLRINLAAALINQNRLDEAEVHLRDVLSEHPDDPNAHYNLGALLARRGNHDRAIAEFQQALAARPDMLDALVSLSISLDALGRRDEALAQAHAAAAGHPQNPLVHHQYGLLLEKTGRTAEAIAELRRAVELAPGYDAARRDLERLTGGR